MMKWRVYVFLCLAAAYVEPALAQGFSPRGWELTLAEGISYSTNKSFQIGPPQSATPIDGEMKIDSNNRHEARFAFFTSNRLGVEGLYGYEATPVVFSRTTPPQDTLSIPLQLHNFGVNFLYYVTGTSLSKWRPFVSVGGGALIYRPTGTGQDIATDPLRGNLDTFFESSRAAVSFGAGLKRSLGRSFGVRFDVGNLMTKAPTFGLPQSSDSPNVSVLPISGNINNFQASIGITLYLGR